MMMMLGVRMFKLAMCSAMLSMQVILVRTKVKFNRDWFLRMCGLMLGMIHRILLDILLY